MSLIAKLKLLKSVDGGEGKWRGLQSFDKVFAADGTSAFFSVSDWDLDTDGMKDPHIHYESTHQSQTSIDQNGSWLNSNTLSFYVLPGGFTKRHPTVELGCLGTIMHGDKFTHAIFADFGPKTKYGEGSIASHRALGYERVKNGKIVDIGIDSDVGLIIYIGSKITHTPCTQSDIDDACKPHWDKFIS